MAYSKDYRLGKIVQPIKQSISLRLDPQKDNFSGATRIELQIKQAIDGIRIHAKNINMSKITIIDLINGASMRLTPSQPSEYDIVTLQAPKTIVKGRYKLFIEYVAKVSTEPEGLYKFSEGKEHYLVTQLQAMKARTVFPSFDEPSFKIPFKLDITVPSEYQVLGNTPIENNMTQGLYTTHYFRQTAPINTDVLAIAVGRFTARTIEGMPISSTLYTTKGQQLDVDIIRRDIPTIFKHIQAYFTVAYPYQKLDFLVLPVYSGAGMENAGLITLHQELVAFPKNNNGLGSYESHKLIAHEIIHMWFGNLVTMAWWDDLWLNESFSEWLARKVVNRQFPQFNGELNLPQLDAFWDDTPSTPAIKRTMKSVDDYNAIGQIVYTKGHAIISMIEKHVGERAFQLAIVDYIKKFSGKNVSFSDFIEHMEKHTDTTLYPIFNSFLTNPQYPLVTLRKIKQKLRISQQPFSDTTACDKSCSNEELIWHVPLRLKFFTHQGIVHKEFLLDSNSAELSLPKGTYAVFADGGALGYFRYQVKGVENNSMDWMRHLSRQEKRSLLANNNDLVKGGYLKYADALVLQLTLLKDPSLSTELAANIFNDLDSDFYDFVPLTLQGSYRDYLTNALLRSTEDVRWFNKTNESDKLRGNSLSFLGTKLLDKEAINFSIAHFQAIINNESSLSEFMKSMVLKVIASNGNKKDFERFKRAYKTSDSALLKNSLIRYMGYFSYQNSVTDYYDFLFSKDVNTTEFKGFYLQYPIYNPKNRFDAIHYLENNLSQLFSRVAEDDKQWQPYSFATGCSTALRQKLNKLYRPYLKEIKGLKDKLANVNYMISNCENMQKDNFSHLKHLLQTQ